MSPSKGKVKKKYFELTKNPNPNDSRRSYLDKKLRKDVRIHFEDTGKKRLTRKKEWRLCKKDKKRLKKMNKKQRKSPYNSIQANASISLRTKNIKAKEQKICKIIRKICCYYVEMPYNSFAYQELRNRE